MPGYIHHIEWCVSDSEATATSLINQFGFVAVARRSGSYFRQIIVQSGVTKFVITEKIFPPKKDEKDNNNEEYYPVLFCCGSKSHPHSRDSVFNVCLVIRNVDEFVEKIRNHPKSPAKSLLMSSPPNSNLKYSHVRSICENVTHTLLEKEYDILPGFTRLINERRKRSLGISSHMDHVTYVCRSGDSHRILKWYSDIFGMKRFMVNPMESVEDGVIIEDEVGMRLMVGEWLSEWLCREEGVGFTGTSEERNFKLVMAEPLNADTGATIHDFLEHHNGPGLQHIGLSVKDVAESVRKMTVNGCQFRRPPPTYYKMEAKIRSIESAGEDVKLFKQLGLLIDDEADIEEQPLEDDSKRYLIQIFSKPLFNQYTFFLEVLERRGARGFGSGNIRALAQSIIEYQKELCAVKC